MLKWRWIATMEIRRQGMTASRTELKCIYFTNFYYSFFFFLQEQWIIHKQTSLCMRNNQTDIILSDCDSADARFKWKLKFKKKWFFFFFYYTFSIKTTIFSCKFHILRVSIVRAVSWNASAWCAWYCRILGIVCTFRWLCWFGTMLLFHTFSSARIKIETLIAVAH